MMKEYQVTLKCTNGKYKPVSCIIKSEEVNLNAQADKLALIKKGTVKIAQKRYWTSADLKRYGYTKAIVREYDKEKIAAAAEEKYNAIKEAKYASGEWKRPKSSNA